MGCHVRSLRIHGAKAHGVSIISLCPGRAISSSASQSYLRIPLQGLTLRRGYSLADAHDRRGTRLGRRTPRGPDPLAAMGLPGPVRRPWTRRDSQRLADGRMVRSASPEATVSRPRLAKESGHGKGTSRPGERPPDASPHASPHASPRASLHASLHASPRGARPGGLRRAPAVFRQHATS
jgi:hypothetical protein